tara:strand:+ start:423 stop:746 length:324 start_codon:yes stop_codon:yes gene_type:complete
MKKKSSDILDIVHKTVEGFHKLGVMDSVTMREFDSLCLPEIPNFKPSEIKKLRTREKVSQPIFAYFLNVSPSTIKKWESGEKYPNGASIRLLDLVNHYGLQIISHDI